MTQPFTRQQLLLLGLGAVGIAVISSVLTYSVTYRVLTTPKQPKKVAVKITPTPTKKPDATDSWKTYTNKDYKYSVKYPANTLVALLCPQEELNLVKKDATTTQLDGIAQDTCGRDGRYLMEVKTHGANFQPVPGNEYYVVSKLPITVGNILGEKYVYTQIAQPLGPSLTEWFSEVLIRRNNKVYEFYLDNKEYEKEFYSILSTITFTQ